MTEDEWLGSIDPLDLAKFCLHRLDPHPFRWLAVEWGRRTRHLLDEANDRAWFDAFEAWVMAAGPHPREVCVEDPWVPLDRPTRRAAAARGYAAAIRRGDPMWAAACAAGAVADDYPRFDPAAIDFARSHRSRSAGRRGALHASEEARRREWEVAKAAHEQETLRAFCDQFRDVAGSPFRPVAFAPAWRSRTAVGVARAVYDDRDFSLLPILADALQDAGCEDADVLGHCRGDGPHVQGCWVVDGVLGKG